MEKLSELVAMAERADAVGNLMDSVNPHDILAIAEALRAAETEAEDTDKTMRAYGDQLVKVTSELVSAQEKIAVQCAEVCKANALIDDLRAERDLLQRLAGERGNRLETAEGKLAELAKKELVGYHSDDARAVFCVCPYADGKICVPVYSRPAPAVDLAELVPDEMTIDIDTGTVTESGHVQAVKWWNACRAEVLRNIEDKKNV